MSEKGYCFLKAVTVGLKQIIHLSCLGRMELKGEGGGAGGDTIENNRILLYSNTIKPKKLNKPNYPKQYAKPSTTNLTSISKIRNSSEPIV